MRRFGVWIVLGVAALALAAGATLLWYSGPRAVGVLTDGETIRMDAGEEDPSRPILWQPATPLPSIVNSGEPEYEPRFSEDGNTLFFVRGKAGGSADIYESRRTFDGWSEPRPVGVVNTGADELGPCPSLDGRDLYFYSNRAGGQGGYDLWVSHREDSEWLPPTNLGAAVNSALNDYGPAVSPDGKRVYFASNRPRASEEAPGEGAWSATLREQLYQHDYDIYATQIGAEGASAAEPVAALNSPGDEGAPCLAPFGDFVYFASDRAGGLGGLDLYRARVREGVPGEPENLGPAINSARNDLDPALTMGGFALYFSSDREVPAHAERTGETPVPQDYNLYRSFSREVYRETRMTRRAVNWAAIWNALLLVLLLGLLALLLWLIARARSSDRFRRLSLFAKCILMSLLIHSLLLLLMAFWQVGSAIQGLLQHSSGTRVALTSGHGSDALTTQVRGGLTDVSITTAAAPAPEAAMIPEQAPGMDAARLASSALSLAARPEMPRAASDARPAVEGLTRAAETPDVALRDVEAPEAPAPEASREVAAAVGEVARAEATPRAIETTDLRQADAATMSAASTRTTAAALPAPGPSADAAVALPTPAASTEVAASAAEVGLSAPQAAAGSRAAESASSVAADAASQAARPAVSGAPDQSRAAIAPGRAATAAAPMATERAADSAPAEVEGGAGAQVAPAASDAGLGVETPVTEAATPVREASASVRAASGEAAAGEQRPTAPASEAAGRSSNAAFAAAPASAGAPGESLAGAASPDAAAQRVAGGTPSVAAPGAASVAALTGEAERTPAAAAPSASGERSAVVQAAAIGAGDTRGPEAPRSAEGASASMAAMSTGLVAASRPIATLASSSPSDAGAVAGAAPAASAPGVNPGAVASVASPSGAAPAARGEASTVVQVAAQGAGAAGARPDAPRSTEGEAGSLASLSAEATRSSATPMAGASRQAADAAAVESAAAPVAAAAPATGEVAGVATPRGARVAGGAEAGVSLDVGAGGRAAAARPGPAAPSAATSGASVAALGAPGALTTPGILASAERPEDSRASGDRGESLAAAPSAGAVRGPEGMTVATPAGARRAAAAESGVGESVAIAGMVAASARPAAPHGTGPSESFGVPAERTRTAAAPGVMVRVADASASPVSERSGSSASEVAPAPTVSLAAPAAGDSRGARAGEASPEVHAAPAGAAAARVVAGSSTAAPGVTASAVEPARVAVGSVAALSGVPTVPDAAAPASRGAGPARQPMLDLPRLASLTPPGRAGDEPARTERTGEAEGPTLELASPAAGTARAAVPGAARDSGVQRVALAPASSSPAPAAGMMSRVLAVPDAASVAARGLRPGVYVPMDAPPAMAIPLPGTDAAAVPNPRGTLSGVVIDSSNNEPLEGATVRLDMPSGDPIMVETGRDGRYVLEASGLPDHVAVSASHEGYTPDSASIASEDLLAGARQDFRLAPTERNLIALEGDPEVHHLGNDEFEGRINSQFQKPSEGLIYEAVFRLTAEQAPPNISRAEIVMLVRGAQAPNEIRINGWLLDQRIDESPEDGSFGEFRAGIPAQALSRGDNAVTIRSRRGSSDLDDFEFVNVRVRLARPASRIE